MPTNPGTTGLVAWPSLDEASGTRVDPHAGRDFAPVGSPGNRAGVVSNALDINAPGSHYAVHTDTADAFRCPAGTSITAVCWALFDSMPAVDAYPVSRWAASGGDWAINVRPDGSVLMAVALSGGAFTFATTPAGVVTTGAWFFLAGWYDHTTGANGTAYIQVNGGTVYSTALPAAKASGSGSPVTLGDLGHSGVAYGDMDGGVDELAVWLAALTSDNRDWLYNAGAGRSYADLTASGALGLPVLAHHHRQVWG